MRTCQVCGNTIFNERYYSHNEVGRVNSDFCSDCYKNGHFTSEITGGSRRDEMFASALNSVSRRYH
jgi:hypothetical protein